MTKNFKKLIFLVLLFSIHSLTNALPTFIEGKVIKGNGMVIRISTYSDQISFNEEILDIHEIDASENFKLGFEIASIQEVFIRIGNQSFSFFAEAGKSYQLEIDNVEIPPKSAVSEQKHLHILWSEKNALNEALDNFNYTLSSFLEENFVEIYKYRDAKLMQSFEADILAKLGNTSTLNPAEKSFFENYIAYKLADLKSASRTITDIQLGETYLKNKPVLYNHPSYMLFFNQYFSQYFVVGKRNTNYNEIIGLVRKGSKASQLLDYIGKDPILIQERLRELVLLIALKEAYYLKDFDALKIRRLIQEISATSKFIEHQKIGVAILNQLNSLQTGAPAPAFKLKSTKGSIKSLNDYKGRYVYLIFMSDNCQACESDMASIERLNEKYKSDIAVVGILVNYTKEGLIQFNKQANASWDRLLFSNDFDLLNKYRVRNFPLYILFDRKGNLLLAPAKKPHEGIDRYFDYLIRRDQDKETKPDILFR